MEKFDHYIKCLGKGLWKVICLILQIIVYIIVWKIAYWGFKEFSRYPYATIILNSNRNTDIAEKIPPEIFERIEELLPYKYTSVEYFCIFLACMAVIMVFAIVHIPRIAVKMNKTRRVGSETIPFLAVILEAILIPILYYMNINKDFTWWIIQDFIIVLIALAIFNVPNYFMSFEYGWVRFLIINLIIAISFGIISVFFLYSIVKVVVIIIVILAFLNFWVPIF